MKNGKMNNGITLIALVVTIIILLILAGVTIGMATSGTGLFDKAKEAAQKYQNAQVDEEIQMAKYSNEIDTFTRGGSKYSLTLLWSGVADGLSDPITYTNGHSIDEFDEIKFVYYNESDAGYFYQERDLSVQTINTAITGGKLIGLYGYNDLSVTIGNISKTGFTITGNKYYVLSAVYGINY